MTSLLSPPSPGHLLDSFARAALWEAGLDYLHGTGHGVGCFLNVHEGPCGISYKTFADEPLEAGMIVSDGTAGGACFFDRSIDKQHLTLKLK